MKALLYPRGVDRPASAGLFVLRVAMGAAFVLHGWPKVQRATGWMGPVAQVPGAMQALAAVSEFGGGALLVLGLVTRVAALGLVGDMVGALVLVHLPHGHPFVGPPGQPSAEPAVVYLACAVLFLLAGPGRFSADALLFDRPAAGPG
jgi:putative oxidoreductase